MYLKGSLVERFQDTPQGGVISPLLENLFLHYCFDKWLRRTHPELEFCRYADDGLIHCSSYEESKRVLEDLKNRFQECGLEIHPLKTKIVYCKTGKRKGRHEHVSFDFLGFTFKPRAARDAVGKKFLSFLPGVSRSALKAMRQEVRRWKLHFLVAYDIEYIAKKYGPKIRGWYNYYSKFYRSGLYPIWFAINNCLIKWVRCKYKKCRTSPWNAVHRLGKIAEERRELFTHWQHGIRPAVG